MSTLGFDLENIDAYYADATVNDRLDARCINCGVPFVGDSGYCPDCLKAHQAIVEEFGIDLDREDES